MSSHHMPYAHPHFVGHSQPGPIVFQGWTSHSRLLHSPSEGQTRYARYTNPMYQDPHMPYDNAYQTYPPTYGGSLDTSHPPPGSSSTQNHGASSATAFTSLETPTSDVIGFSKLQVAMEPKESIRPAEPHPCVQICPHEALSFDRLQRILALPNFEDVFYDEGDPSTSLNALTASSTSSPHPISAGSRTRICALPNQANGRFKEPQGKLCYASDSRGLSLHSEWTFTHRRRPVGETQSEHELRLILDNTGIFLCPHRKLSDPLVVKAIYGNVHPDSVMDPIDHYLAQDEMHKDCKRCATTFETKYRPNACNDDEVFCTIKTTRTLGHGQQVEDPVWLAQCGL